MNCEIVKLEDFSGNGASIYSLYVDDLQMTLYDKFILENKDLFIDEIIDINTRLITIGKLGAREQFFKLKEGNPSDGVCALYDNPNSNLRLYCIRYASGILLVGGGGHKPKSIRTLQDDEKLKQENYFLRALSKLIQERMNDNDLRFTTDYLDFDGEINFLINTNE